MREVEFDHAFSEMLGASVAFQAWVLSSSRFARFVGEARLLVEEQSKARRSARHWWKHWWGYMPDGSSSETDIFAVFENAAGQRFALHFENKPAHGVLELTQAAGYRPRAALWANNPRYLRYTDFETVLLAPKGFIAAHGECAAQFDRCLPYEDIGQWVPQFAMALS